MTVDDGYDVVVVGGAVALGRARRRVLVVDAGRPRNAPAGAVHNFLGLDGVAPGRLLADGRAEVLRYGGQVVDATAEDATRDGDGFVVRLGGGRVVRGRRLLVTTGLVDELPDVPGLAGRWGRDVLHCPYCHGWEVRDRRIGVLATGPLAVQQALLWRQWSPRVVLLRHGVVEVGDVEARRLAARQVSVVDGPVVGLEVTGDALTGVRLAGGGVVALDALVVGAEASAAAGVLGSLGLAATQVLVGGQVVGAQVDADGVGATAVPGVWVAGNVADVRAQVVTSAAAGLTAAAAINADLVAEETDVAVAQHQRELDAMVRRDWWERRYEDHPVMWSGRPNPQLVAEAADLPVGRALDVGCGEGADAVWLASRGWRVTAVDIAAVAVERAAAYAAQVGGEVAARITWRQADLREQPPAAGGYDLVSAQYMHLPREQRRRLFAGLAEAVAPGGTLLIVGHDVSDLRSGAHRAHFPELMYSAGEVAGDLDPGWWEVRVAQARPRVVADAEGRDVTVHDAVLVARRR
ncbi:methyltransferase domain-containing protein [Micromonospora sp. DT233]|uniref:methyltransferase domain-containing protein n=1 Tax=Micromonospora sp. DT233 TaxID=3393432 RepID=UPI003CEEFD04